MTSITKNHNVADILFDFFWRPTDLPTDLQTFLQTYIASPICFIATPKQNKVNCQFFGSSLELELHKTKPFHFNIKTTHFSDCPVLNISSQIYILNILRWQTWEKWCLVPQVHWKASEGSLRLTALNRVCQMKLSHKGCLQLSPIWVETCIIITVRPTQSTHPGQVYLTLSHF